MAGIGNLVSRVTTEDPGDTRSRYHVRGHARELPLACQHVVASRTKVRSSAAAVTPANVLCAGWLTVASRLPVNVSPTTTCHGELVLSVLANAT